MIDELEKGEITQIMINIRKEFNRLEKIIANITTTTPDKEKRLYSILEDIYNLKGIITKQESHDIVIKHGMQLKGLGGLFVGTRTGKAHLVKLPNDKISLTPYGQKKIEDYIKLKKDVELDRE